MSEKRTSKARGLYFIGYGSTHSRGKRGRHKPLPPESRRKIGEIALAVQEELFGYTSVYPVAKDTDATLYAHEVFDTAINPSGGKIPLSSLVEIDSVEATVRGSLLRNQQTVERGIGVRIFRGYLDFLEQLAEKRSLKESAVALVRFSNSNFVELLIKSGLGGLDISINSTEPQIISFVRAEVPNFAYTVTCGDIKAVVQLQEAASRFEVMSKL